jgi:stearoyl-CoA desaturase (Delta-9 desaturase)
VADTRLWTTEALATVHPLPMPTRGKVFAEARTKFARTRSLDEIVERAYELVFVSVGHISLADSDTPIRLYSYTN